MLVAKDPMYTIHSPPNKTKELFPQICIIKLTHCGRVMQICVYTLQLCKTDDAHLRF